MPTILLRQHEVADQALPRICTRCGKKATRYRRKTFAWHPAWAILLLLFCGVLPGVILILIIQKRMTTYLPLCRRHRNHFRGRTWLLLGTFLAVISLFVTGVALLDIAPRLANVVLSAGVLGLFGWVLMALVISQTTIRPTFMTETDITLTAVSERFIRAVRKQRHSQREGPASETTPNNEYELRYQRNRERRLRHQRSRDGEV